MAAARCVLPQPLGPKISSQFSGVFGEGHRGAVGVLEAPALVRLEVRHGDVEGLEGHLADAVEVEASRAG